MNFTHNQARAVMERHWSDRTVYLDDMAEMLGCSRSMVSWLAVKFGLPKRKRALNRDQMPVRIRGVDYPTVAHAAAAFGIKTNSVYTMIIKGTVDNVGLGHGRTDTSRRNPQCKAITIGPYRWHSISAAARDLGVPKGTLYGAVERGDTVALTAWAMAYSARSTE